MLRKKDKKIETGAESRLIPDQKKKNRTYYDEAIDWEISRTALIAQSERRAWFICVFLLIMLVCSWAGLFFLLPLKKDVPYMTQVDNATGRYEVSQVYYPHNLREDELRDKYWINYFIKLYESYNFHLLKENYRNIQLFTEDEVLADYQKLYKGDDARQKIYGRQGRIEVDIISIMIRDRINRIATVRFNVLQVNVAPGSNNTVTNEQTYTVELKYGYEALALDERDRMINPLGFRVKSYQLAPDN